MKIGIMGAMIEEVARITSSSIMSINRIESKGKRDYFCGYIKQKDVVVVFSRLGKVAASSTATSLIDSFGVDIIIFVGVAGAIDPTLAIGDIVVADKLVQHDIDVSALPGISRYEIPLLKVQFFPTDADLVAKSLQAAKEYLNIDLLADIPLDVQHEFKIVSPKSLSGLVASGDQFIASESYSNKLRSSLPGLRCVEMVYCTPVSQAVTKRVSWRF